MIGTADEEVTVHRYLKENWDGTYGPMDYENLENPATRPGIQYVSVVIVDNPDARVRNSRGAPRLISQWGFVVFTVYTPQGKGAREAKKIIDFLTLLFDEIVLPMGEGKNMVFGVSSPQTLGVRDGTYRITLSCPFRWDNW